MSARIEEGRNGLRYWWVRLEGKRESICVGDTHEVASEDVALTRAATIWAYRDRREDAAKRVSERNPNRQVFEGLLPQAFLVFSGDPGEYAYVLGDRRRAGRWVVKDFEGVA